MLMGRKDTRSGLVERQNDEDTQLIQRLLAGDEAAFEGLVRRYQAALARLAGLFLDEPMAIEEVVQETWVAVLRGLRGFEGRSSLKTWLLRIAANQAKSYLRRQQRYISWSVFEDDGERSVASERFYGITDGDLRGEWRIPPSRWDAIPEQRLLSQETFAVIQRAIEQLPPNQRAVITLRDVYQIPTGDVCELLEISEGNQRVLLHRARAKVRQALESYWKEE